MKSAIRTSVLSFSASLLLMISAEALQNPRSAVQIPTLSADQLEFLSHVSMLDLPDGQGGVGDDRTGSHNLVTGNRQRIGDPSWHFHDMLPNAEWTMEDKSDFGGTTTWH